MGKTLDDVKTFLEGQDGGIELYEAISSAILHERNTGKGLVSDERRKVERFQKAVEKLGYDGNRDMDDWLSELLNERDNGKKSAQKLTEEQRRLIDLERKFEASEKKARELEQRNKHSTLKEKLMTSFGDKLYSAEQHAKNLILEGKVDVLEDGKTIVWKDGGNSLDFDTGLSGYFEANKDSMKNNQTGGASRTETSSSAGEKVMLESAFNKLDPMSRMTFIQSGGKVKQ